MGPLLYLCMSVILYGGLVLLPDSIKTSHKRKPRYYMYGTRRVSLYIWHHTIWTLYGSISLLGSLPSNTLITSVDRRLFLYLLMVLYICMQNNTVRHLCFLWALCKKKIIWWKLKMVNWETSTGFAKRTYYGFHEQWVLWKCIMFYGSDLWRAVIGLPFNCMGTLLCLLCFFVVVG